MILYYCIKLRESLSAQLQALGVFHCLNFLPTVMYSVNIRIKKKNLV